MSALAIQQQDLRAIGWAILAMGLVILAYDQLLFRPLVAWAEKFRVELSAGQAPAPQSWVLDFIQRARARASGVRCRSPTAGKVTRLQHRRRPRRLRSDWRGPGRAGGPTGRGSRSSWRGRSAPPSAWWSIVGAEVHRCEALGVVGLGFITLLRVLVLIALASLVWVPIGVVVGLNPRWAAAIQPVAQFMAAFPDNLFFPVAVVAIVHFHLDADVWLSPLMILGTQWYILFNVIAGRLRLSQRPARGGVELRRAGLELVAQGYAARRLPLLRHRRHHRQRRRLERLHRGGGRELGPHQLAAHGLGAFICQATARATSRGSCWARR